MSDAKTSYIVLENKVKVKKGNVDISTRLMEVGVSDKALRKIRKIQGKMAKEVKAILNEENRRSKSGTGSRTAAAGVKKLQGGFNSRPVQSGKPDPKNRHC